MPHARPRLLMSRLKKRLSFFPVVAIQGARQTGKSFLVRELLAKELPRCQYVTFDHQSSLTTARIQPHGFLEEKSEAHPLMIDEAQKVPAIFEAVKYEVDRDRRPGRFVLLGSTEFSKLTLIRESLTGRMGRVRLFPLTLAESLGGHLKGNATRAQTLTYLKVGGMPAIFHIRDEEARNAQFQDWIDLTCSRDILQFKTLKLDPEITFRILSACAKATEPTRAEIARTLRLDGRRVQTHLNALTELFVLHKLDPHPSGHGKPIYLPLDTGVAKYLGADLPRLLHIFALNELMAKNAYFGTKKNDFFYYRSTGKRMIHIVEVTPDGATFAYQVLDTEMVRKTDAELMRAFLEKNPEADGKVLAPVLETAKLNGIPFTPWEWLSARSNPR